jgi:uncharacterized protein
MRIRGYAPATPCWVELASTDPGRVQDFYAELFGWEPAGDRFRLRGRAVAGLTRSGIGRPGGWLTYLAAPDVEAAVHRVTSAGGWCLSRPADAHGGRAAIVSDTGGAPFGLWQAADFAGAQIAGEPSTMAWPELVTEDPRLAAEFYGNAFGWSLRAETPADDSRGDWLTASRDAVAGLVPGYGRTRWRAAFQVADCDRAADACLTLGGRVIADPEPMSLGTFAELADPYGAEFAVAAPARPAGPRLSLDTLIRAYPA